MRIQEDAVINIKNRSFSIVAEVENPDGNAEGTLVTLGGETGGFAFQVVEGKPTFHYNWIGREQYTISSSEPLPKGECTIRFDLAYDGGAGKGGTGTLSINGERWPKAGSRIRCRSTSRRTILSMWVRTGARRCRRPTSRRSSSPVQ